jgi:peptidoglycan/LPS O-acetylase OafA/YrhL
MFFAFAIPSNFAFASKQNDLDDTQAVVDLRLCYLFGGLAVLASFRFRSMTLRPRLLPGLPFSCIGFVNLLTYLYGLSFHWYC